MKSLDKIMDKFSIRIIAMIVVISFISFSLGVLADNDNNSSAIPTIIEAGSGVETASYIIYKDGDYVCAKNGTTGRIMVRSENSSMVIQSAIDATYMGGMVVITNGIYEINAALTVEDNNIKIMGYNATLEEQRTGSHTSILYWYQAGYFDPLPIIHIIGDNTIIEGLTFTTISDGSLGVWVNGDNAAVLNSRFEGLECAVYGDAGADRLTVNNNYITSPTGDIQVVARGEYSRISDNRFYNLKSTGIYLNDTASFGYITGNSLVDCVMNRQYYGAIWVNARFGSMSDVIVSNNIVKWETAPSTNSNGILFEAYYEYYLDRMMAVNNIVESIVGNANMDAGLYIHGNSTGPMNTIRNSHFTDNIIRGGDCGVRINCVVNSTVVHNQISKTVDSGILLSGTTNCTFNYNHIHDSNYGIYMTTVFNTEFVGNHLTNCTTSTIRTSSTSFIIRDNYGYRTELWGVATILAGQYSVTIAHGMPGKPIVVATGNDNVYGDIKIDATGSSIVIKLVATLETNINVGYYAFYLPSGGALGY